MEAAAAVVPTTDTFESSTTTLEQAGLDRDGFLTIFLKQLEYQDPFDPQDSSELSAQLATFSQLEQSVVQVDQLRGINQRLDELIEASNQAQTPTTLDPVSLIGRQISVATDEIFVPGVGDSIELGFDIEQGDAEFLSFLARDPSGQPLGLAAITAESGTFALGQYTLQFSNGTAQLQAPGQAPIELIFLPLTELPNGELAPDLDPNAGLPAFLPGSTYGFEVEGTGRQDQRYSLATSVSGLVTSVRVVDGFPVLVVGGQDVDLTKIVRIQ